MHAKKRHLPCDLRIRRILEPVTALTWAMPWESRSITPICDGVIPFFAILVIWSTTPFLLAFSHDGADLLYGLAEREIPLLLLCTAAAQERDSASCRARTHTSSSPNGLHASRDWGEPAAHGGRTPHTLSMPAAPHSAPQHPALLTAAQSRPAATAAVPRLLPARACVRGDMELLRVPATASKRARGWPRPRLAAAPLESRAQQPGRWDHRTAARLPAVVLLPPPIRDAHT